jgi:hypothetical protein
MERKRHERAARFSKTSPPGPSVVTSGHSVENLSSLCLGILSFFTGNNNREELLTIQAKCQQRGVDLEFMARSQ